jgi:carotenoid cleavage dioxygenase-like enzyme
MTSRPDGSGSYISEAVDEGAHGLQIDVRSLGMYGPYRFNDDLEKPGIILIGNPAHGAIDENGVRWATVGHFEFTSQSTGKVSSIIYKIENNSRSIQGVYKIGEFDLALCRGDYRTVYPNLEDMMGYMHSFILTPRYVVLPMTSLAWNFCGIFLPKPPTNPGRFFFTATTYQKNKPVKFLVFDREAKVFVADLASPSFFISHQANWYEDENGNIVADMIVYDEPMYQNLFLEDIINNFAGKNMTSSFDRFVIDTKTWTVSRKQFPTPADPVKEFCQINHEFRYKPYKYTYMVSGVFMKDSSIIKYNVETGRVEARWGPFPEVYPGEPIFVPRPGGTDEDDGVVLVGGLDASDDSRGAKGFVAILNARTLEEVYVGLAPENTPPGLHNYFSPQ